jgi:hypothetical protein
LAQANRAAGSAPHRHPVAPIQQHALRSQKQRTLGPAGLPDGETPRDERNAWELSLGPDDLQLDDMVVLIEFDRRDRMSSVVIEQS